MNITIYCVLETMRKAVVADVLFRHHNLSNKCLHLLQIRERSNMMIISFRNNKGAENSYRVVSL